MEKEEFYWNGAFGEQKFKAYKVFIPFMFLWESILALLWVIFSLLWMIPFERSRLTKRRKK